MIDSVLRTHHTEVGDEVLPAPFDRTVRLERPEPLEIRAVPDDEDVLGTLAPASERHGAIRLVCRDDDVREAEHEPLEPECKAEEEILAATEPREIQLRNEIVMVEDEPRARALER